MKNKLSCVLLIGDDEKLNNSAICYARKYFLVKKVVNFHKQNITEAQIAALKPGYVFNFLSDKILKGPLLKLKNINFHPAPPEWPGRGSASLALFAGDKHYGATAHIMSSSVDSGKILLVKRFPISPLDSCEYVFRRGQQASLSLFKKAVNYISKHGRLPPPCGLAWKRKPSTKKEFQKWLILDPKNKKEFIKKIKASVHSKFDGPYVVIHGYKFALVTRKNRESVCQN
ncbi:MAG: formyltransferase family protein [Candidatus Omnitrophica bacterium]|jgi:methionyl-tRNA formyltransferase|nr:formyltransferase family protein [Candidatus Omnitrophota bacterium]MDD5660361.1 formyltransferase family protein [Candidatus Omnitrophota bacterium]